jgi:hypothetical protein
MSANQAARPQNLPKPPDGSPTMPKIVIWLLIIFALLFVLGVNAQEIKAVLDLGSTICLSCIGVG